MTIELGVPRRRLRGRVLALGAAMVVLWSCIAYYVLSSTHEPIRELAAQWRRPFVGQGSAQLAVDPALPAASDAANYLTEDLSNDTHTYQCAFRLLHAPDSHQGARRRSISSSR